MKRRAPSQKLTRHRLQISAEAKAFLDKHVHVGRGHELHEYVGWRDQAGNIRRARATFDNGWTVDLSFSLPRGEHLSFSYRLRWRGEIRGKAA